MSKEEYTLLPLTLPADGPQICLLDYQIYISDPSNANIATPEDKFCNARLPQVLSRFSNPGNLMAKLVLSSDPSKMVSYVVFTPPGPPDERTDQEKERDLKKMIEGIEQIKNKELTFNLKMEDKALNDRFLGELYESRFWELTALMSDPHYQRKGLGSRLVEWGLNHVEGMVKRSEGRLEGCYLIASPAGVRTYLKAGFEMVGQREAKEELEEKHRHCWFVRRFV